MVSGSKVKDLPTLKEGMNCDKVISRKKKLKKNLNWLNNTTGMKVSMLYF